MANKKVLNLYAGIGGNRKLWENVDVTAVENNIDVALVYCDFFPDDKVVRDDAHQYLLHHYDEFDFIWTSPPCTSHSQMTKMCGLSEAFETGNYKKEARFPDMKLYEEIIFLQNYFQGKWVVENVIAYYPPLIKPQEVQRHWFWSNVTLPSVLGKPDNIEWGKINEWQKKFGFDLSKYHNLDKRKALRNCVDPQLGKEIFDCVIKEKQTGLIASSSLASTPAYPLATDKSQSLRPKRATFPVGREGELEVQR
jgi:DNA (cytosine-5)-methyltransferase 1